MRSARSGWYGESYRHYLAAKGVRTYSALIKGKNLPAQLHIGAIEVEPERFQKDWSRYPSWSKRTLHPSAGHGLWTSTFTPPKEGVTRVPSDWGRYISFVPNPAFMQREAVIIRPTRNAKIFSINNKGDVKKLYAKYGTLVYSDEVPQENELPMTKLDWEEFAKDYDAIRLQDPGLTNEIVDVTVKGERRPVSVGGWDAESTFWLRPAFRKIEPVELNWPYSMKEMVPEKYRKPRDIVTVRRRVELPTDAERRELEQEDVQAGLERWFARKASPEELKRWRQNVNMSPGELKGFMQEYGDTAGLSRKEAAAEGIKSGRDSARAIIRMKQKPVKEWNENDLAWMRRQNSFVARMKGAQGPLYDEKGRPTRKLLALKVWGHDPEKQ